MRTIYLLQHRPTYGSELSFIRAYENEESAKADAEAFKPVARSGSLEIVPLDFMPATVFRPRDLDPTPKAALP